MELTENMAVYKFDSGKEGPHVLISAGVHGDEYEPMLAIWMLIAQLPDLLKTGKVTLVPVVNWSAYANGTREGKDGLDLARSCPGSENGSETELAAAWISQLIRQSTHYIDLHTGGRAMEIYPLVGYMLHASEGILNAQRKMAHAFGLPLIWGTDSSLEGRTLSIARDVNVPAIYVEYGGGDKTNISIISAYLDGCINVLNALGMVNDNIGKPLPIKHWIEDPRPNSGHLQSKMPAPCDGIFVPVVNLGEAVEKGQPWGHITAMPKGEKVEIKADRDGFVLFLRASSRVRRGDTLGGILSLEDYLIKV